jgi:hypothetical protein
MAASRNQETANLSTGISILRGLHHSNSHKYTNRVPNSHGTLCITKLPEWDVILHIVALYHVANLHGLYESHVKYVPHYANVRK